MNDLLALFALPDVPPEKTYGQSMNERMHALATSPEVIEAAIEIFRAHPGEYIDTFRLFGEIRDRFELGSYVMDTLHHMNYRLKMLEEKRVYHGAESPCAAPTKAKKRGKHEPLEKPYLGFHSLWRLKEPAQ